jgi:cyclic pyranopterin phosphate synthase
MPKEVFGRDYAFLPRAELLSFEEIVRLARLFVEHGVTKVRLTGGEPLLRRDIERLVGMLAGIQGIADVALTTNGTALAAKAQVLGNAGLTRVTVSLDALDDETFTAMNDVSFPVSRVLDGIDVATRAGLWPVKVNMVVKRGVNDHAIVPMAAHFRNSGHILRFIEYMDVGTTNGWRLDDVVPAAEIRNAIDASWPLEPLGANYPGEVASRYRYRDGAGEIGVIASVTQPFCGAYTFDPGQSREFIQRDEEGLLPSHVTDDSHDELRERMSGNLCRCGAQNGIVDAIAEIYAGSGA